LHEWDAVAARGLIISRAAGSNLFCDLHDSSTHDR
jgi:hypothetical protein